MCQQSGVARRLILRAPGPKVFLARSLHRCAKSLDGWPRRSVFVPAPQTKNPPGLRRAGCSLGLEVVPGQRAMPLPGPIPGPPRIMPPRVS